jgi:hypothetical protein
MVSIHLRQWYNNITITMFDIIHHPVFYLKHDISETQFCLCPQVVPTQTQSTELVPIRRQGSN